MNIKKIKPFKKCEDCKRDEGEEFLDIKGGLCLRCRIKKKLFSKKKQELLEQMLKLEKSRIEENGEAHLTLDSLLLDYIGDEDIRYLWNRIPKVYANIK